MKHLLPFLLLLVSCSKAVVQPEAPKTKHKIILAFTYASNIAMSEGRLNGKVVFGQAGPSSYLVDSADALTGTLELDFFPSGSDWIAWPNGSIHTPQLHEKTTYSIPIRDMEYFLITIGR